MHILFATIDFVENNGPTTGLPKYLLRTGKQLVQWGHKVTVVTCSNCTVTYDFMGMEVHRVRRVAVKKYNDQEMNVKANALRDGFIVHEEIKRIAMSSNIDIIQYTSLKGIAYYHDFNIPSVVRLSSYAKMWPVPGSELKQLAAAELECVAATKCDGVFGPSHVVAQTFGEDIGRNVDVIETPFLLETKDMSNKVYDELLAGKKYILFFGTLVEYKGLGVIERTIYKVLALNSEIYFVIIGDGEFQWRSRIKKAAREYSERVLFHEAIGFSELIPSIKNASLVVLPSLMENFSNACVEAMALGSIVLGTNGASFDQLINDGDNGYLCEINDDVSFANKVNEALNISIDKRRSIIEKATRTVERLAPNVVTQKLLNYYLKVIHEFI